MFSSWFFFLLSPPSRWGLFVVNDAEYYVENFGVDDHYYPLGGPITQYSSATSQQPLKFQGKEWSTAKSMNLYDFGARRYDPASGRWLSQDPLAEKYYAHSPYLFCAANPMKFVDPTGESIRIKNNTTNALIDLAHIVATKKGTIYISDLIRSLNQYDLNPVAFYRRRDSLCNKSLVFF